MPENKPGLDHEGHATVPRTGPEGFLGAPFELANDRCDGGPAEKAESWMTLEDQAVILTRPGV